MRKVKSRRAGQARKNAAKQAENVKSEFVKSEMIDAGMLKEIAGEFRVPPTAVTFHTMTETISVTKWSPDRSGQAVTAE